MLLVYLWGSKEEGDVHKLLTGGSCSHHHYCDNKWDTTCVLGVKQRRHETRRCCVHHYNKNLPPFAPALKLRLLICYLAYFYRHSDSLHTWPGKHAYTYMLTFTYPHAENMRGSHAFSATLGPLYINRRRPTPIQASHMREASTPMKKIENQKYSQ